MEPYSKFRPTPFDSAGAFLPERQDWLVTPVCQTRDSGPLVQSNFSALQATLDECDPDEQDHELHRFGHWGPGWLEIIIVRPGSSCETAAREAEAALEAYPVLDDEDCSRREWEAIEEAWGNLSTRERIRLCATYGVSVFAARREEVPRGNLREELRPDE